ncbi:MAG: ankyrin repeat domain-containing protein [Alphaproteobacteria bacterium]|nr:ankyrin repeat domain-containing protein [Alphaproteobacteria bacterium]
MNLLKKAFTSWEYQFRAAVKAQDAAEVANLLDQMHVPLEERELEVLAREANLEVLKTYFEKVKDKGGWGWMFSPINYCLDKNLFDRVDLMLEAGIDFNREDYKSHPLQLVLKRRADVRQEEMAHRAEYGMHIPYFDSRTYSIPSNTEKAFLGKMAACGIGQVHGREDFLRDAIATDYADVVDLLIQLGVNPQVHGKYALHLAAEYGREEICRYLIEKFDAHVDYVIADARRLTECYDVDENEKNKEFKVIYFLTEVKKNMNLPEPEKPVAPEKPATIETLSEDLKKLREMVAELTQKVVQLQNPVVRLDKNSNSTPQP